MDDDALTALLQEVRDAQESLAEAVRAQTDAIRELSAALKGKGSGEFLAEFKRMVAAVQDVSKLREELPEAVASQVEEHVTEAVVRAAKGRV